MQRLLIFEPDLEGKVGEKGGLGGDKGDGGKLAGVCNKYKDSYQESRFQLSYCLILLMSR